MRPRWYVLVVGLLGPLAMGVIGCRSSVGLPAGTGGTGGWGGDPGIGGYGGWGDAGLGEGGVVGQGGSTSPVGTAGPSAQDTCNQLVAVTCERTFACGRGGALTTQYASAAACTAALETTICASSRSACPAGEMYHADLAQQCTDGLRVESCADLGWGIEPSACSLVCGGGGVVGVGGNGGPGGIGGWGGQGGLVDQGGAVGWGGQGGMGGWDGQGGMVGEGGIIGWGGQGGIGGEGGIVGWGGQGGIGGIGGIGGLTW